MVIVPRPRESSAELAREEETAPASRARQVVEPGYPYVFTRVPNSSRSTALECRAKSVISRLSAVKFGCPTGEVIFAGLETPNRPSLRPPDVRTRPKLPFPRQ